MLEEYKLLELHAKSFLMSGAGSIGVKHSSFITIT